MEVLGITQEDARSILWGVIVAVVLAIVAGAGWYLYQAGRPRPAAPAITRPTTPEERKKSIETFVPTPAAASTSASLDEKARVQSITTFVPTATTADAMTAQQRAASLQSFKPTPTQ